MRLEGAGLYRCGWVGRWVGGWETDLEFDVTAFEGVEFFLGLLGGWVVE